MTRRADQKRRKQTQNDANAGRERRVVSAGRALDGESLRPLWLFFLSALFVAMPLLPSESAVRDGLGVVLITFWLVFLMAWLVGAAWCGRLEIRFGPIVLVLLLMVIGHSISALVMGPHGQPRYSWNMLWQWVSLGICFFLAMQVVRTGMECRAFASVALALAVLLSSHGYYQYFFALPVAREAFAKNPEKELRDAGIYAPPGSVERKQYEDRLRSTEPFATFSLANSLAAMLSPWLLVVIGITATNLARVRGDPVRGGVALATTAIIAGCWVLTKSRASWSATLIAIALLAFYGWRRGWWRPGRWTLAGFGAAMLLSVLFGIVTGSLDLLVLSEAAKSFLYRTEYWQATLEMIQDHPWFGCGPGNFQQYYTAYKLPEASETISDPHNFLLEIWATAGTPTMIAFVALSVVISRRIWISRRREGNPDPPAVGEEEGFVRPIYWGALAGFLLAFFPCGFLVGYPPERALWLLVSVGALVLAGWHWWVVDGELRVGVTVCAVVALLISLTAAGGISFAGVAGSLWLLVAIALVSVDRDHSVGKLSRGWAIGLAMAAGAVGVAFHQTMYVPVLRGSALVDRGLEQVQAGTYAPAEATLKTAASVDSYSKEPWQHLTYMYLQKWLAMGKPEDWSDFEWAAQKMLQRNKRSNLAYRQYADWALESYLRRRDAAHLELARKAYQRAVDLYPNSGYGHALLAWASYVAGREAEARLEAEEAIRLDRLNPHSERKLAARSIVGAPLDAEQLMEKIRKSQE